MSKKKRLLWLLWHPHQGLWNWDLVGVIRKACPLALMNRCLIVAIIFVDSVLLFLQAVAKRVFALGINKIFSVATVPDHTRIVWIDLGTHEEGAEMALITEHLLPKVCNNLDVYGFEANPKSFKKALKKFRDKKNIQVLNKALCETLPPTPENKIKLYVGVGNGLGDSIYRKTDSFLMVDTMRLSDFLREKNLLGDNKIVLLRMNIEGSEYDVIKDLVSSGLSGCIDGFFGMWDDLSKIDVERDDDFRKFLLKNKIQTFPFNGRDLKWSFRKRCILYHVHSCILRALSKNKLGVINQLQKSSNTESQIKRPF